ncbi:hypothetical protein [Jiangella asiatica]|uniref:Uncharacterized protein n=1 Tax=Jiangella asiatica TaxID=2530372 RepID=A0A4R5DA10_9ACTN|nr:hypothetical protein [Jiangella asiatica]TDE08601.1 hypothetical protein E1269_16890 [Jiangella asiatica]
MILTVVGFVLFLGGSIAVGIVAGSYADSSGLLDIEPAWAPPVFIGGLAVGMVPGLTLIAANNRSARSVRKVILTAIGATALGAVLYVLVVGGLIRLLGLTLPNGLTMLLAVVLSIVGLPVVGPLTYYLLGGRRARDLPGGRPVPRAIHNIRRRDARSRSKGSPGPS